MDLKDNGKGISGTACKGDDSESHDEKHDPNLAENFAKAVLMWLDDLIEDAGITEEEWKEALEGYDVEMGERFHKDILTME